MCGCVNPSESILESVKKLVAPGTEDAFNIDLIMHINTVFNILQQLGVGPEEGFEITDKKTKWGDYTTDVNLNFVKSYMVLQVRLLFDPPQNGSVTDKIKEQIKELEWRINVQVDPKD